MERRNFLGAGLMAGLALTGIAFTSTTSAAWASGAGPNSTGPDPAGPDPAGPDPAGPDPASPDPASPDPASPAPVGPDPAVREAGLATWPLFEWEQRFEPPPLAVYADDTAYADAAKSLKIPPIWVSTLREHALDVLGRVRSSSSDDHLYDQVRVRTNAGDYLTVRLDDWQDGDPRHAYPPQIRELYQHAMGIRRHVLAAGRPWTPTGVLLTVVTLDHRPDHFRPWPPRLPTPDGRPYQEIRLPDGPAGLPRATIWPSYRVGPNHFVAATWRPLLPHEIT